MAGRRVPLTRLERANLKLGFIFLLATIALGLTNVISAHPPAWVSTLTTPAVLGVVVTLGIAFRLRVSATRPRPVRQSRHAIVRPRPDTLSPMALDGARLFHVNVNCSDLERSRRFYTEGLGLDVGAHTAPETTQPGGAFGLESARWDASILLGPSGYEGGAIDLLQWHEPTPIGAPPKSLVETGFQRLGIRVTDFDATLERVTALGGSVWTEPFAHTIPSGEEIHLVLVGDPDGTAIELIESKASMVTFVSVTCADLECSLAFYLSLGFRELARYPSDNPDGAHLRLDGPVGMDEIVLGAPGGGEVTLMLIGFRTPPVEISTTRAANTLGMWRAAFIVTDLDAAVRELANARIPTISEPVSMAMGPGLPTLRFVCFRGPDGEVVELIEQPS